MGTNSSNESRLYVRGDESGDTPTKKTARNLSRPGATSHYVVSFVTTRNLDALALVIENYRARLGPKARKEFHFSDMKERERKELLQEALKAQFGVCALVVEKGRILNPPYAPEDFYRHWVAETFDVHRETIIDANIVLDRTAKDKAFERKIETYLLQRLNNDLERPVINEVGFDESHRNDLLQLADVVAGSIRRAYENEYKDEKYLNIVRRRCCIKHAYEMTKKDLLPTPHR